MLASGDNGGGDSLRFSHAGDIVELVVLTTDEVFLQTLRDAVGGAHRVWHVAAADKVSSLLLAGEVGILVLDTQCVPSDAANVLTQIKRQFPDLVVIAAGGRDDEASLAGLISGGVIYRFIHKPMSPGRAKLFSDAAVRKYLEGRARVPAPSVPHRKLRLPEIAAVAGLMVLIVGAAAWTLLRHGRSADAGLSSMPAQPPPGAAEIPASAAERNRLVSAAEDALLEERLDAAATAIAAARKAGVDNARLGPLSAQLARSRERAKSAAAQNHIRSDAASSAATAGDGRLTRLLRFAAERIEGGQLIDPPNDSARLYVSEALRIDPNTNATQAAKQSLALALLREAHTAIDRRDFAHAAALLDAANGIAAAPNVASLRQQLAGARTQAAASGDSERLVPAEPQHLPEAPPVDAQRVEAPRVELPPEFVPASELTVVTSVPPTYPQRAELDRIEGWVELDFTVTTSGGVKDITVHGAKPAGVFNQAAISALSKWRYKPVERDAQPIAQRARIRIRFILTG